MKTVAEWFPKKERALAAGIFNAGTNVGVVLAPLVVPWITIEWGWRWAFIVTGATGFIWLAFWLATYRDLDQHPKVSPDEVAYIRSDGDAAGAPIVWSRLLGCRQTWAFMVGKAFTDPVWFFYLFWLPKFLDAEFGVRLSALAAPLVVIYVIADFGSVGGGWTSSALIKRGWSVNRGRKTAMLLAAVAILPTVLAPSAPSCGSPSAVVSRRGRRAPVVVVQPLHLVSDTFPQKPSHGRRHRRLRWCDGVHGVPAINRRASAGHGRQLHENLLRSAARPTSWRSS